MQANFEKIIPFTLHEEGGYQNNRADSGNWSGGAVGRGRLCGTKYGISAAFLAELLGSESLVTPNCIKNLTEHDFESIAQEHFWDKMRCNDLPAGCDLMVFDFGFNSGPKRSIKLLQTACGLEPTGVIDSTTLTALKSLNLEILIPLLNKTHTQQFQAFLGVEVDGVIGPQSRAAITQQNAQPALLLYALASLQEQNYRSFKTFRTFGPGWLARLERRLSAAFSLMNSQNSQKENHHGS